jgi:hypothetical protein
LEQLQGTVHLSENGENVPISHIDIDMMVVVLRNHFNELVNLFKFLIFKAKHGNTIQNNGTRLNYDFDREGPSISADAMQDAGLLNDFGNTNFNICYDVIRKIDGLIEYAGKEALPEGVEAPVPEGKECQ